MKRMLRNAVILAFLCLLTAFCARGAAAQTLTVDTTSVVRTIDANAFGVNVVFWSDINNYMSYLQEVAPRSMRWGGGSAIDDLHWSTDTTSPTPIDTWLNAYSTVGATAGTMEVNYGSGTAQEAASLLQHCISMGYRFKYWELGNETYGDWETDNHAVKQDPNTCANQYVAYRNAMRAVDPNIKLGIYVLPHEDDWTTAPLGETAVNPRTGITHHSWTPVLLNYLKNLGVTPDYVIWHAYPYNHNNENDANLLSGVDANGQTFAASAASIRQMLTDYLGAGSSQTQIYNTEWSTVGQSQGKQACSLVSGLYMAQSVGASIQTEIVGNEWWVFNNSNLDPVSTNNNSASLYGWRLYGDYALVQRNTFDRYPTFYVAKLLNKWLTGTDQVISATTTQTLLTPYAVKHADGSVGLIVINKSPTTAYTATTNFTGYSATGTATVWSYGIANDNAAQGNPVTPARDLTQTTQSVSGSSISGTYQPYSVTLINLPSATAPTIPPVPAGLAAGPGPNQIVLTWNPSAGATSYSVKRSTVNGSGYATVASPVNPTCTNNGLTNGVTYYYVVSATNTAGTSGNSAQVSATPQALIPFAPAGLTATRGNTVATLAWNASFGAATYNVKRGTVSGGGYATITSPTVTNYTDTGLTNGTAYYYVVSAVNAAGESPNSSEATVTPVAVPLPLQVNCAGPPISPFISDSYFSGGTTATSWTGAVDTTAVTNPAPQAVYQTERYGAMTYTFTGLPVGQSVNVRLHMCENYYTASGQRTFNAAINGTSVLSAFDIFATAGAAHKAVIREFAATVNASGQVVVAFTNIVDNALIDGIEVLATTATAPAAPTGLTATAGNTQAVLSWAGVSNATSYNVSRSTVSGSGYASVATGIAATSYTNTGLTNLTNYYFVVSATNSVGTSANSAQASAMPSGPAPQAQIAAGTATIDGIVDAAWSNAISYPLYKTTGALPSGHVLSAAWQGMWDATNLYILVNVTDDVLLKYVTNPWEGDSVEVFLDATNSKTTTYGATDFQYEFPWNSTVITETKHSPASLTGVAFAQVNITGGYRIEAKIPWTTLGVTAAANNLIGVDVHVNNADTTAGTRDGKLEWNDGTDMAYINPSLFGTGMLNAAAAVPAAPTGLTATAGNAQVALSWTASSGATSYNVSRSTVSGSGYASVATGIATTSYTNTGLTNGIAYYFVVSATNASGTSANSTQASATPVASTGNTHTGTWAGKGVFTGTPSHTALYQDTVAVTANTNYVASVWIKGTGVVSLYIYQGSWGPQVATLFCTATSTWQQFTTPVISTGANTLMTFNIQDDSTTAGTVYVDDCFLGVSGGANVLPNPGFESGNVTWAHGAAFSIVQPGGAPAIPAAPTGLTATPGNAQVSLSWTASSGATSYNVLRSTVSGSGYAAVVSQAGTTYTNTGLTNGTAYYFVVTATNTSGTSANSAQASATPIAPPAVPAGLTATPGNTQVALSWTASPGAASYTVKRSTVTGSGYANVASPATTTYTNTGLTNGTVYYFVVSATNAGGTSANSAQASATPVAPPTNTHSGTWAGKGVFTGTPSHTALYQDTVAVTANTNFVASVWIKGTGVVSLYIYQGSWGPQVATLFCTATSTWQQFTTPVISTGANTLMTFNIQDDSTTAGTVYVDDCFLGVANGANVLPNPGFESGNVTWGHGAAFSIVQNP